MTIESLVLTRHFKAPPERVFAAFTEKPLMQGWFGPQAMTVPQCEVDARVGGKYRVEMHGASGSVHVVTGEFKEIDAPRRLVFSWGWLNGAGRNPETLVTLTFEPSGDGTELTLVQSGFLQEEFRKGHGEGWNSSFNGLDEFLAGRPKPTVATPEVLGDARSSYTLAVRLAFFEKGVAHTLKAASPHSPEVDAFNPFGRIPVLRLGPDSISEASAILRYIDEVYPGPSLMPGTPLERARAEQWVSRFNAYCDRPIVRNYVLQYIFPRGAEGKPDRATIEAAIPEIRKALAALDAAYGERNFIAGEAPSLPDLLFAPPIHYLGLFPEGRVLIASFVNVKRAHDIFAARPSFLAATKQGG